MVIQIIELNFTHDVGRMEWFRATLEPHQKLCVWFKFALIASSRSPLLGTGISGIARWIGWRNSSLQISLAADNLN